METRDEERLVSNQLPGCDWLLLTSKSSILKYKLGNYRNCVLVQSFQRLPKIRNNNNNNKNAPTNVASLQRGAAAKTTASGTSGINDMKEKVGDFAMNNIGATQHTQMD